MNAFIRLGAMLFTKESMDIQESGHAAKEEQKTLISLIHPRNLMPVQGELFMRVSHKQTAVDM
jgi:mRNA degradation ribonuclease J1/J2